MGWVALFTRGLPLRIVMIGTLTGLQWGELLVCLPPGLLCWSPVVSPSGMGS